MFAIIYSISVRQLSLCLQVKHQWRDILLGWRFKYLIPLHFERHGPRVSFLNDVP